jgi:hypothetical protein
VTPEARTALRESIAHWERMRDDPDCGEEPYDRDCALCAIYYDVEYDEQKCMGCPVFESSGSRHCIASPYERASREWRRWRTAQPGEKRAAKTAWRKAAQAEIDFLRSLLDEEPANA